MVPSEYRINFKIANITFHTLHSSQPACLYSALHGMHALHFTHSLRLSNANLLFVSFVCTSSGVCSFSVAGPTICNSLPPALRMCTAALTLLTVISRLTISSRPFNLLNAFLLAPQIWLLLIMCVSVNYIYLLTVTTTTTTISTVFWDMASLLFKSWQFSLPHMYLAMPLGMTRWIFIKVSAQTATKHWLHKDVSGHLDTTLEWSRDRWPEKHVATTQSTW